MRARLLTRPVATPGGSVHQGAYYQHLTRELGVATRSARARLACRARRSSRPRAQLLASAAGTARAARGAWRPGAAYGTAKRWLPEHYVALVVAAGRPSQGVTCVLVGSRADATATREVFESAAACCRGRTSSTSPAHDLADAGRRAVAGRSVCVSNDSGAMHLAAARRRAASSRSSARRASTRPRRWPRRAAGEPC